MNQYTDITVLECNRLHSEEAKTNNNENFALWTNNLQDIVHIEAGDRVSVQGAMVNEKERDNPRALKSRELISEFRRLLILQKSNMRTQVIIYQLDMIQFLVMLRLRLSI